MLQVAGAEGWGDRPVRRRSRFTLACARAEPLALGAQSPVSAEVVIRMPPGPMAREPATLWEYLK